MSQPIRRTLIIGFDYSILHAYARTLSQLNENIKGFLYCGEGPAPYERIRVSSKTYLRVVELADLEKFIMKEKITNCRFLAQNIPMKRAQSIINRIAAVNCSIEFYKPKDLYVKCNKPTIVISALATSIGKTQICRYFCTRLNERFKVAVIFPITEIFDTNPESGQKELSIDENGMHFELQSDEDVDTYNLKKYLSEDDCSQIKRYFDHGVSYLFATTDVRKAVISAEQIADFIVIDSLKCEISNIEAQSRICIVSKDLFSNISKLSLWPGLVNVFLSSDAILVSTSSAPLKARFVDDIKKILNKEHFFYVQSQYQIDNSTGTDIIDKQFVFIEHEDNKGKAFKAVKTSNLLSASGSCLNASVDFSDENDEDYDLDGQEDDEIYSSPINDQPLSPLLTEGTESPPDVQIPAFIAKTPRSASPLEKGVIDETDKEIKRIAEEVKKTDVEYIIVSLQTDLDDLFVGKKVIYTIPEIIINDTLDIWIRSFFRDDRTPPLLEHFAAQVDIIMAMAHASDKELFVSNNDSANREAFCRLFLSSHIPPGFQVTTGEIMDANSNITGQLDVVVTNANSPRLTIDSTNSIVAPILADNVLCVIEVKTSLTSDQLKKALYQMRSVKALMPTHSTILTSSGKIVPDPLEGKIITGIFSFNKAEGIENEIDNIVELFPGVIDFIVIPDSFGYFSVKTLNVCGIKKNDSDELRSNDYIKKDAKGVGLAYMFGILNSVAAIRRFSGAYCLRYINGFWGDNSMSLINDVKNVSSPLFRIIKTNINSIHPEDKRIINNAQKVMNNLGKTAKDSNTK